jgi:hypothetical protein
MVQARMAGTVMLWAIVELVVMAVVMVEVGRV